MNGDFLKKLLNMDELIIFKNIDNMYIVGLGLIIMRFLIEVIACFFRSGSLLIPIVGELILSVFYVFLWRSFCEILYCVAPKDTRNKNNRQPVEPAE